MSLTVEMKAPGSAHSKRFATSEDAQKSRALRASLAIAVKKSILRSLRSLRWSALDPFDPQHLRSFPPGLTALFGKVHPIVFPIPGNAGEQSAMGRHAFMGAQDHAAPVNNHDFGHGFLRAHCACARIVEIKHL